MLSMCWTHDVVGDADVFTYRWLFYTSRDGNISEQINIVLSSETSVRVHGKLTSKVFVDWINIVLPVCE